MASAPHEPQVAITVKDEEFIPGITQYPPLLSPYLVHGAAHGRAHEGAGLHGPLRAAGRRGGAHGPPRPHRGRARARCPTSPSSRTRCTGGSKLRHTVLFSNKTWGGHAVPRGAGGAGARAPGKLRVVHTLTREMDESRFSRKVRKGRVGEALLEELIPGPRHVPRLRVRPGDYPVGPAQGAGDAHAGHAALHGDGARPPP